MVEVPCVQCGELLSPEELEDRLGFYDSFFKGQRRHLQLSPTVVYSVCCCYLCATYHRLDVIDRLPRTEKEGQARLAWARAAFLRALDEGEEE